MNIRKPVLLTFVVIALIGCGSESNEGDYLNLRPVTQVPRLLSIEVEECPLIGPEASTSLLATKAAITTTSTLTDFNLDYIYGTTPYQGSTSATKNAEGQWISPGTWPYSDDVVKWYASSQGNFYLTDDDDKEPYIQFAIDELSSAQEDLLVATASGSYVATGGKLSFTFDHACAALRFWVKKARNLDEYTLSITEVKLCNIIRSGQYFFNTLSWQLDNERSEYTLYSGTPKTLGSTDYEPFDTSDTPYLFIIPQTLTPWDHVTAIASVTTQTYIQITCTLTNDHASVYNGTAYIPFAAALTAGYQHEVKINIGKNSLYSGLGTKIIID